MIRRPSSKATGWIVAAVLGALLTWYVFSDTPLRLGDRRLRVYDVRDLVVDIPDFRFDDEGAGDLADDATRAQRVSELGERVRDHVAPGTWDAGDVVNFAEGERLLIVGSEAKHRLVQGFFDQLRATQQVQVTVEARFLSFGPDTSGGGRAALDAALAAPTAGAGPLLLDDDDVAALLRTAQASRDVTLVTAPRLTLFNGQRAYVLVETQRAYASDLTPKSSEDGSVQYVPKIETARHGVLFEVRATASADRRRVTLYLHPRLRELRGMTTFRVGAQADGKALEVQRPEFWTAEVRQTVTVPDGRTLVVRDMLRPSNAPPDVRPGLLAPPPPPPEEVVLLVKASVIDPPRAIAPAPAGSVSPTTRWTTRRSG